MAEKILIVDDDLDTLRLVGLLLQRKGYQILAANHGSQAIEKAMAEQPDLLLLDVMMPDMDGFEVVRRLRSDPATANIPIIMFTAKTQVDDKVTGFEAGADDYLTKPTHPAELIARVKAILARSARKKSLAAPAGAAISERGKIVGVLAAKGGMGVTTTALNLGLTLHKTTGETVLVADYRPGDGSMSLQMGYQLQAAFNQLVQQEPARITMQAVEKALVSHDSGLHLLLSSYQPTDSKYLCAAEQFAAVTKHLPFLAKYTVLDLGPSLPPITEKVIAACDQLVVLVEPSIVSVIQAKALLDDLSLKVLGLGRTNVVMINRVRGDVQMSRKEVQDRLGHALSIMFTPVPELAYQSAKQNVPMVMLQSDSLIAQQFAKLAELTIKHGQKMRA